MKGARLIVIMLLVLLSAAGIAYSADADKGKGLFNDTKLGTNGKSCNTCHSGGKDIDGSKKTFEILGEQINSISEAVNFCIENALDGKALDSNSEDMKSIVSYIKTLKGKKVQKNVTPGY